MSNKNKRPKIKGPYVAHTSRMLGSPAFRALSLTGHRILARIELELCSHAGKDNGNLIVTYDDFERFGIDRHAIGPGLRELEALGFIEIVQRGRAGNADHRRPHIFRLTYLPTDNELPTDEWQQIKTVKEAEETATQARKAVVNTPNPQWGKTPKPVGVSPTGNPEFQWGFPPLQAQNPQWGNPPLLSRIASHLVLSPRARSRSRRCDRGGVDAPGAQGAEGRPRWPVARSDLGHGDHGAG